VPDIHLPANFVARAYQKPIMEFFDTCLTRGVPGKAWWCVHRRGGKDRTMLAQISKMAFRRVGTYWHMLPTLKQARKTVWQNITKEGTRLIETTFPPDIIRKTNEAEMTIELKSGSIVQLMGADNFDSNIGAGPVHVTFSEYAVTHPRGWNLIRPILTENNGTAAFVSTPRGYNDFYTLGEAAKRYPDRWYRAVMDILYTGVMTPEQVAQEIDDGMPVELARQEYYCDFSAANVGAILGTYIENAEKQGRITEIGFDPEGAKIELSCDIGFRDTTAFWAWQRLPDEWYAVAGYDEANKLDASDWIERFQTNGWTTDKIGTLWMPHDAKAKTFSTKTSAMERFKAAGYNVKIVPMLSVSDRINAARVVARRTIFGIEQCRMGLKGLRAWQFDYNEDTNQYSPTPKHDWASHPGDAYSYGAVVMYPRRMVTPPPPAPLKPVAVPLHRNFTLEDLWDTAPNATRR
jgi:hypothetical protein